MAFKYTFNPISGKLDIYNDGSGFQVKDPVDTYNDLPITGNVEGDLRYVKDTDILYAWSIANTSGILSDWKQIGGSGSGDMTKAVYDTGDVGIVDKAQSIDDNAGNTATGASIGDAVSKAHNLGADTTIGEQTADISMGNFKIKNAGDPTLAQDLATKNYVDTTASGISNIVEDVTPQLGGDLDLNGNNIDFPSVLNISDCLDEDNMVSDSATALVTQQSIKKYVDDNIASGTSSYRTTFTDVNLTAGILTVNHTLGEKIIQIAIYDNNDKLIVPDEVTLTDTNNTSVDLSSYGTIVGTWNVVVIG